MIDIPVNKAKANDFYEEPETQTNQNFKDSQYSNIAPLQSNVNNDEDQSINIEDGGQIITLGSNKDVSYMKIPLIETYEKIVERDLQRSVTSSVFENQALRVSAGLQSQKNHANIMSTSLK